MVTGDLPPTVMVVQESTCANGARSDEGAGDAADRPRRGPGGEPRVRHRLRRPGRLREQHPRPAQCGRQGHRGRRRLLCCADVPGRRHRAGRGQREGQRRGVLLLGRQPGSPGLRARLRPRTRSSPRGNSVARFLGGTAHNFGSTAMQRISIPAAHGLHAGAAVGFPVLLGERRPGHPERPGHLHSPEQRGGAGGDHQQPRVQGSGRGPERRVQWHGHVRRLHHDRQSRRPRAGTFQVRVLRRQP